jgi:hypothetical protein
VLGDNVGAKAHRLLTDALLDDVGQTHERAAADKQDVGGVDLQKLLLRVLATAFGWHIADSAFQDLQQRLLHTFTRDIAGDAGVVALAGNLVDLVDVDNAALGPLDVMIGVVEQADDDVLDVLTDVASLGKVGRIGNRKRHIEHPRQRLRQQRLATARRADQQDVGLLQLRLIRPELGFDALVVIVDTDDRRIFLARSCPITYSSMTVLISAGLGIAGLCQMSALPSRFPRR